MAFCPLSRFDGTNNGNDEEQPEKPAFKPIFDTTTLKARQYRVTEGGTIRIELSSFPKPEVEWFWQRMKITEKCKRYKARLTEIGEDRYACELTIDAFSVYNAGNMTIMAVNRLGKAIYDFNIQPDEDRSKPIILKGPYTRYMGNSRYRLEMMVWSPENESIVWRKFKKGKESNIDFLTPCKNSPEMKYKTIENDDENHGVYEICLEIAETSPRDRGTYRCEVLDKHGFFYCDFPLIFDKEVPVGRAKLVTEPKIIQLKSHNIIFAFCISSDSYPVFSWIFPSGRLFQGDEINEQQQEKMKFSHRTITAPGGKSLYEARLNLDHWFFAEQGMYTCLVSNTYGCLEVAFELKVSPEMMKNPSEWFEEPQS